MRSTRKQIRTWKPFQHLLKKSNLLSEKYLSILCFLTSERALQRSAGFDLLSFRYEEHIDEDEVW